MTTATHSGDFDALSRPRDRHKRVVRRDAVQRNRCRRRANRSTVRAWRFAAVIALLGCAAGAAAQEPADPARGKAVFEKWCAPCHGDGPGKPGTAALQALYGGQKPALLEERTDLVPDVTKGFVRSGVSVMPFFRKTEISDSDLDALAAYLAP